jgi:hypothetical protein
MRSKSKRIEMTGISNAVDGKQGVQTRAALAMMAISAR